MWRTILVLLAFTKTTYMAKNKQKFSIEELVNNRFPYKLSSDIDLDPCKSGELIIIFFNS